MYAKLQIKIRNIHKNRYERGIFHFLVEQFKNIRKTNSNTFVPAPDTQYTFEYIHHYLLKARNCNSLCHLRIKWLCLVLKLLY